MRPITGRRRTVLLTLAVGGLYVLTLVFWTRPLSEINGYLTVSFTVATIATTFELLTRTRRSRERIKAARQDPSERLQDRIRNINLAFTEAATLMDELRRDLEAQQTTRAALQAEAERQQRLLELNQEEAEKIRKILVDETRATIRAERLREWGFFLAGIAASVPIGIWVNHIST